jgi:hypothetical protein
MRGVGGDVVEGQARCRCAGLTTEAGAMASRTPLASLGDGEKIALMKIARLYARKTASSAARFAESKFFDAEP